MESRTWMVSLSLVSVLFSVFKTTMQWIHGNYTLRSHLSIVLIIFYTLWHKYLILGEQTSAVALNNEKS